MKKLQALSYRAHVGNHINLDENQNQYNLDNQIDSLSHHEEQNQNPQGFGQIMDVSCQLAEEHRTQANDQICKYPKQKETKELRSSKVPQSSQGLKAGYSLLEKKKSNLQQPQQLHSTESTCKK